MCAASPCEQQAAKAHRFGDEGAQRRDRFLDRRRGDEMARRHHIEARPQLVIKARIAPGGDVFVDRHLDVVAAAGVGTHRAQREPARMMGIDQLVRDWRRVGEQPEPAKREGAFVQPNGVARHAGAADAMEAVAAGDGVAVQFFAATILFEGHARVVAVEAMHRNMFGLIDGRCTAGGAHVHQVARHLGLAIDRDGAAATQCLEVDAMAQRHHRKCRYPHAPDPRGAVARRPRPR